MEMAKKLAEENEAIGGDIEENGLVDTDAKYEYVKMDIPEWFCSAICGGLNMDEIQDGSADIENPADFDEAAVNMFDTEEE